MYFEPYPFEKLNTLLKEITPNPSCEAIALTIGEPQFETPVFIQEALKNNTRLLNKYPKSSGEAYVMEAQRQFVQRRFGVELHHDELISTFGTREVLFNFPQFLLHGKLEPVMAYTNPFYQIYEGAAIASRAKMLHLDLTPENGFKPDLNLGALHTADLVILNFPNNPTGVSLGLEELGEWVKLALKYDFVLLNDECYSEIYTDTPPPSLLEASVYIGNERFKNILVVNSISKRSSAPGLRSGFIAGDGAILRAYAHYRSYVGAGIPLPLQVASSIAWSDDEHVELARAQYRANLALAREILGVDTTDTTFYVWLDVGDGEGFTKALYEQKNIKVLPGKYLARGGIADAYVRIALVENHVKTEHILKEIQSFKQTWALEEAAINADEI